MRIPLVATLGLCAFTGLLPGQYGCALKSDIHSGGSSNPSGLTSCDGRLTGSRC